MNGKTDAEGRSWHARVLRQKGRCHHRVGTKDPQGRYALRIRSSGGRPATITGSAAAAATPSGSDRRPQTIRTGPDGENPGAHAVPERHGAGGGGAEGVIDAFSHTLTAANPLVSVPIKASYGPKSIMCR